MPVTTQDLDGVHARVGRLETKVDAQQSDLGEVKASVAWIKGYLQTNGHGKPTPMRDGAMVAGGGGIAGTLLVLAQMFLGE